MADTKIVHLNDTTFTDQVVSSDLPVLVDFWADWCGPCHAVAPILEELAEEMGDRVRIAKLDVDQNQALTSEFDVSSIPTLLLFKDGQVTDRAIGALPKAALREFVERNL